MRFRALYKGLDEDFKTVSVTQEDFHKGANPNANLFNISQAGNGQQRSNRVHTDNPEFVVNEQANADFKIANDWSEGRQHTT